MATKSFHSRCQWLPVALMMVLFQSTASAFSFPSTKVSKTRNLMSKPTSLRMASTIDTESIDRLDVILFGVGDLRTVDHGGIANALQAQQQSSNGRLLALTILDETTLSRIPSAVAHTIDTASMVEAALQDLQTSLKEKYDLDLHVVFGSKNFREGLDTTLASVGDTASIHLHACDLGDVDNSLGYGAFAFLKDLPDNVEVSKWACPLREEPFQKVDSLPETYPEYSSKYSFSAAKPLKNFPSDVGAKGLSLEQFQAIPPSEAIARVLQTTFTLDSNQCNAERNTGLYGTHWGGLDPSTIGESRVVKAIRSFTVDCEEDDEKWVRHATYDELLRKCRRNGKSLEHASVAWMMKGDGKTPTPTTQNMLPGESMTRFLSAPLLFGTVSPRYVWHSARISTPFFTSSLREMTEAREWHQLLGAKRIRSATPNDPIRYSYWRWHGFLCRYAALTDFASTTTADATKKTGILLVHGFGASGSQMTKMMAELAKLDVPASETLAPDLLGFGECEKPPVTYTQYLWENFILDFCKEIALGKQKWDDFVIGGNSIGGYTSMSVAANDAVEIASPQVSGSGAPGTNKCLGVVLMNSAGQLQTKEQVEEMKVKSMELKTVAQLTAMDALPSCRPLARPVARAFSYGLLGYLRPRIKSISTNLYPTNPAAVDDNLCGGILRDSLDPGAINVMISGSKLPPSRTANELLAASYGGASDTKVDVPESAWKGPVLIATGIKDPLNDAKGRTEMFGALREGITMAPIEAGHCPHDELPDEVAAAVARWMNSPGIVRTGSGTSVQGAQVAR